MLTKGDVHGSSVYKNKSEREREREREGGGAVHGCNASLTDY